MSRPTIYSIPAGINSSPFMSTTEVAELVGFNTGNLAFRVAIECMIERIVGTVGWHEPSRLANASDLIVMPCANHLGAHCDLRDQADALENIKKPIVAIGLGAQADNYEESPIIPQGTIKLLDLIASRSPNGHPNIWLRGEYTRNVLRNLKKDSMTTVLGCPSLFLNPSAYLGEEIARRSSLWGRQIRVSVAAGHFFSSKLRSLEIILADLVTITDGIYVVQAPLEGLQLARGEWADIDPHILTHMKNYTCPNMENESFLHWCRHHMRIFFHVGSWMEALKSTDFLIGTRIHGVIIALQSGIPALCIAHDTRTQELCEIMKIPHILFSQFNSKIFTHENLRALFSFNPSEFDTNHRMLAKGAIHFMISNELEPSRYMYDIAGMHK